MQCHCSYPSSCGGLSSTIHLTCAVSQVSPGPDANYSATLLLSPFPEAPIPGWESLGRSMLCRPLPPSDPVPALLALSHTLVPHHASDPASPLRGPQVRVPQPSYLTESTWMWTHAYPCCLRPRPGSMAQLPLLSLTQVRLGMTRWVMLSHSTVDAEQREENCNPLFQQKIIFSAFFFF